MSEQNVLGFDRQPTHVVIPELNNLDRLVSIRDAIRGASFSASEADKVMDGNWLRVIEQVLETTLELMRCDLSLAGRSIRAA